MVNHIGKTRYEANSHQVKVKTIRNRNPTPTTLKRNTEERKENYLATLQRK